MPKLDLVTRWTKAVAAFKHMTEDEDFGPIYTKSFKIEYVEHERLLRDVEMAVQLNKADDVAKASAAYEKVTKTFIGVLAKLQAKVGGKEMRVAVKKLTDEIDFLRKSTKDLGAKFEKAEPPAKEVNWKTVFTPDLLAKMTKLSMESGEYKRFAAEFNKVIKDCGIGSQATALPAEIWKQLVRHVVEPDEFAEKVGNSAKPQEAVLAEMGKALGTSVCKDAFDSAMKGLQPFSEHSERHLDRVIRETQRGSRWVFWSGTGAREAATKEAGGVVLDETIGKWFDDMWDFGEVNVRKHRELWTSFSEIYVKRAAQCYSRFRFIGYVGPGATRDQGAFTKLEKPTVLTVMSAKATVPPPALSWVVVDCEQDGAKWKWSKKPSVMFASRSAALGAIKARYGA